MNRTKVSPVPDRQDSHGDWMIELGFGIGCAVIAAWFAALFVYLLT